MSILFYGTYKSYLKFLLDPSEKKSIPKLASDLHCYLLPPKITSLLNMMEKAPDLFLVPCPVSNPLSAATVMYYCAWLY